MLQVLLSSAAERFLKRADKQLYERLKEKIKTLAEEPFPPQCLMVKGREERLFRVRVGDYRILYAVFFEKNLLFVADIDKRARVYE